MNRLVSAVLSLGLLAPASIGCASISESSAEGQPQAQQQQASAPPQAPPDYAHDVAAATFVASHTGGTAAQILESVGSVAREHGVTDWESIDATYRAMGQGLKRAGIRREDLAAWSNALFPGNPHAADLLAQGYGS